MITAKSPMNIYLFSFFSFIQEMVWVLCSKNIQREVLHRFLSHAQKYEIRFIIINLAFNAVEIFINDTAKSNKYSWLLYNII